MKKILGWFLCVLLCAASLQVCAADYSEGDYTYSVTDDYAVITAVNKEISGAVLVPSALGGYPVREIAERAFYRCNEITEIEIPDGIERIGKTAFGYCKNLEKLEMSDSVISIASYAFRSCYNMTSVRLSSGLETLSNDIFNNCAGLTSVEIPESVTMLENYCFRDCSALVQIDISKHVTDIASGAFSGCTAMERVHVDAENAFYTSVDGMLFDKAQTTLLYYPGAYGSVCVIPETVEAIGSEAFRENLNLTDVYIPSKIPEIGRNLFLGCNNLKNVHVSEENPYFSSIDGVLYNKEQSKLLLYPAAQPENYTFPDSVSQIQQSAFRNSAVMNLYANDSHPLFVSIGGVLFSKDKTELVAFPRGRGGAYTVPEGVTTIGESAFISNELEEILFPDTLTCIAEKAFYGSAGLTAVVIPKNVTTIGADAFGDCHSIVTMQLPGSAKDIGYGAFNNCTSLISIALPDGISAIPESAFYNCAALESITIPASVKEIGYGAFGSIFTELHVYFGGTRDDWEQITVYEDNDILKSAAIHYNASQAPMISVTSEHSGTTTSFAIMLTNAPQNATLVLGVYRENRLVDIQCVSVSGGTANFQTAEGFDVAKVLLLENLTSFVPLCGSVEIS